MRLISRLEYEQKSCAIRKFFSDNRLSKLQTAGNSLIVVSSIEQGVYSVGRLLKELPAKGFSGLHDLLLLIDEIVSSLAFEQDLDDLTNAVRVQSPKTILKSARIHLVEPGNQTNIDNLLSGLQTLCSEAFLEKDDIAYIRRMLLNDRNEH